MTSTEEIISTALRKAFRLGEIHWQQVDSEYPSHGKKGSETEAKFEALIVATLESVTERDSAGSSLVCKTFNRGQYNEDTAEANARLIAEAGTVAHETGLTPRQLAEQRKELLEAATTLIACDFGANGWDDTVDFAAMRLREAVAKATGQET